MPSEWGMKRSLLSPATPVTMPRPLKFKALKLMVSFLALDKILSMPASHMKSSYWFPDSIDLLLPPLIIWHTAFVTLAFCASVEEICCLQSSNLFVMFWRRAVFWVSSSFAFLAEALISWSSWVFDSMMLSWLESFVRSFSTLALKLSISDLSRLF